MKTSNRVRRETTAANVPAQTQNQVQPDSEQQAHELASARRIAAQFYEKWRLEQYADAVVELAAFGCAIQHNPDLQPISEALRSIYLAEDALEMFNCVSNVNRAAGIRNSDSDEERAARIWFEKLYQTTRAKTFLSAQIEFAGLYLWIKGQVEFSEVSAALAQFLAATGVLDDFLETVTLNEEINPTERDEK